MSIITKIEWCHHTASPWYGCTKVSPGCANCYAEGWAKRGGKDIWGKGKPRQRSKSFDRDCRKWDRELAKLNANITLAENQRVFPSLCDWLDDEVPLEWLADCLNTIKACPNLTFLLLTKRPELFHHRLHKISRECELAARWHMLQQPPENVWLGVSAEDQKRADERIQALIKIEAKVRFLSVEPLLEKVDLGFMEQDAPNEKPHLSATGCLIDWVIVGGESGGGRRDCGVDAIGDVASQCVAADVPCFVKQDCALHPGQQGRIPDDIWKLKQFPK